MLATLASASPSPAIDEIVVDIGRIDAGRWSSGDIELRLRFASSAHLAASLVSADLQLPRPLTALKGVSVDCPIAEPTASGLACARAELRLSDDDGRSEAFPLAIELDWKSDSPRLKVRAEALSPASLWAFVARDESLPALDVDGAIDIELELAGGAQGDRLRLAASVHRLSFSDSGGLNAGENLGARAALELTRAGSDWRVRADAVLDAGQMYLHPVFVDASAHPLGADAEGRLDAATGALALSRVRLRHDTVAAVDGSIDVGSDGDLVALDLELANSPIAPVYRSYLQPFVIGSVLDDLSVDGEASALVTWRAPPEGWRARVAIARVDVGDVGGRFGLSGVRGRLVWHQQGEAEPSRIDWDGGRIYRIAFGAGGLAGRASGRRFRLQERLEVPFLGGALEVDDLRVDAIGRPDLGWQLSARVQPVSLEKLTEALAWPTFSGTLAGDIPLVRYSGGVIGVDGGLDVRVFDGRVRIDDLTIRDAFGVLPELRADVDLENLSLDALTGTFSFGNIQGRLEGRIHGLTLKDWKPTAFDARFATPDDDDSRHRISQRAVSNLASLGGAGEVLSSTFLRIFDEFSYRRLGIACRLENGVCEMDGIAPAEHGYYIVEGGGLPPRIDVLGFNRRVDWEVLLGRLRRMVAGEAPVIR